MSFILSLRKNEQGGDSSREAKGWMISKVSSSELFSLRELSSLGQHSHSTDGYFDRVA